MISTKEFGRLRREVMKELAPDFIQSKNNYVRESENGQIHCIGFSIFSRDSQFSLEYGLHYAFAPSFDIYSSRTKTTHPEPATCALFGALSIDGSRTYTYGDNLESSKEKLESAVSECLVRLNTFNEKWGDGNTMLKILTPKVMREDAINFLKIINASDVHEQQQLSDTLFSRCELPGLDSLVGPLSLLLAFIAKEQDKIDSVEEYLEILEMRGVSRFFNQTHKDEFLPHLLS